MSDLVGNPKDWFSHDAAHIIISLVTRKPVLKISDCGPTQTGLYSHKINDGKRLEILDLGSRGYFLCSENKGADLVFWFGLMLNIPVSNFFSYVGTEPPLPGYNQYSFG